MPTLLASIERDLPDLRVLLIGGEACPPALVKRWSRPGRKLLNSYGPTEATVTATLGRMSPERGVTIGRPLPTYSIVILDAERAEALPLGEAGEIGIAGIGVAEGYLNRPELTEAKFIAISSAIPNNPSGRIYRTGDLGRINAEGEIEYLGRIDTQVKLRGYRIELTEIESVLLEVPDISQAAVATFEPTPGAPELVAYYSVKHGAAAPTPRRHRRASARPAAGLHDAGLSGAAAVHPDAGQQQGRPRAIAEAEVGADPQSAPPMPSRRRRLERLLCEALKSSLGSTPFPIDGDFFKEYARPLAADGAVLRAHPPGRAADPCRHARHLRSHDRRRLAAALQAAKPTVETYAEAASRTAEPRSPMR